MSAFNIFLIIFVIVAAVFGFIRGLVRQVGSIVGIIIGIIICRIYGPSASAWLHRVASPDSSSVIITVLAYIGLFVIAYMAVWLLALLLKKTLNSLQLGFFDRLAGALFKIFLWLFCLSLLLNVWVAIVPMWAPRGVWAERVEWLAPTILGTDKILSLQQH